MLDDYRTAPIDEKLRATIAFLEKVTLTPDAVTPADVAPVRGLGVSRKALGEALYVCALFNLIDRVADALAFELQSPASLEMGANTLLKRGYV